MVDLIFIPSFQERTRHRRCSHTAGTNSNRGTRLSRYLASCGASNSPLYSRNNLHTLTPHSKFLLHRLPFVVDLIFIPSLQERTRHRRCSHTAGTNSNRGTRLSRYLASCGASNSPLYSRNNLHTLTPHSKFLLHRLPFVVDLIFIPSLQERTRHRRCSHTADGGIRRFAWEYLSLCTKANQLPHINRTLADSCCAKQSHISWLCFVLYLPEST